MSIKTILDPLQYFLGLRDYLVFIGMDRGEFKKANVYWPF
jgi:hypothetical protein